MKIFLPLLLVPLIFSGCISSDSDTPERFTEGVFAGKDTPREICKSVAFDFQLTQLQEEELSANCPSAISDLQDNYQAEAVATSLVTPGTSIALLCQNDELSGASLLPILLREQDGKIIEIHIYPHINAEGDKWKTRPGVIRAGERARDELPKKCRELEIFRDPDPAFG